MNQTGKRVGSLYGGRKIGKRQKGVRGGGRVNVIIVYYIQGWSCQNNLIKNFSKERKSKWFQIREGIAYFISIQNEVNKIK